MYVFSPLLCVRVLGLTPRQSLAKGEAGAQDLTDGFKDLFREVGYFKTHWAEVVKKHQDKIDQEHEKKLATLTKRIQDLNKDLERCATEEITHTVQ